MQSIGDPLEYVECGDLGGSAHDFADFALAEVHGNADAGLTHARILPDKPENLSDVPFLQGVEHFGALPEVRRDHDRFRRFCGHMALPLASA